MSPMRRIAFIYMMSLTVFSVMVSRAATQNVVINGGFEMSPDDLERPPYWYVGFKDSPPDFFLRGQWSLDTTIKNEGVQSIKLEPRSEDEYLLSQILHAPTHDLTGKTVTIRCDIRHQGLTQPPVILVYALNWTLPPDPLLGVGIAGKVVLSADGPEGQFQTVTGQFTATDNANVLAAVIMVVGTSGTAWFDNVIVEMDVTPPGPDPDPVPSPVTQRRFNLGFVQENPIDPSEKAMEELIVKVQSAAEVLNLFAHVRWCSFTGEDIEFGHRHELHVAEMARAAGLRLALTFDFTHNAPDDVGHINPTPDGTAVGSLDEPAVARAYEEELLALCDLVLPEYVIVGIEVDIFHNFYPD